MIGRWKLEGIDAETWFGLRLQCLLVRKRNTYAVKITNLRITPLINLRVSVSATIFDDDGRMDFLKAEDAVIHRIDAFASFDVKRHSFLSGASYWVDCEYSDIEGNVFHERFLFDVCSDSFQNEVSSLPWYDMYIFTHFGNHIGNSLSNPVNSTKVKNSKRGNSGKIDMSSILVLGPDTGLYISRLREIQEAIFLLGYNSFLVREQKELGHETVEQKLLKLALSSRFVIIEDSIAAGHIDELSLIARSRTIVAVLREHGKAGTWMQCDYDLDFPVQYFNYNAIIPDNLYQTVSKAVDWADGKIRNRRDLLEKRYPWR